MEQILLDFAEETPLHRERDRPKGIKPNDWSAWIDRICVRGGVPLTHEGLMRDFAHCCPQHSYVKLIKDLHVVHLMHWEGYWDRERSWST
jgi:hypothetical protein